MYVPPRYRRYVDGHRVLWRSVNWLQGAKGAGAAARKRFVELMRDNGIITFTHTKTDVCTFVHRSDEGYISFNLHVDDGCGGWTTTPALSQKLYAVLEKTYPGVKWRADSDKMSGWALQLGFEINRDRANYTTTITAPRHIEALRAFVKDDAVFYPKSPSSQTIMNLKPAIALSSDDPGYAKQQHDISWTRGAGQNLKQVLKLISPMIRADIMDHICRSVVVAVPLFAGLEPKFLSLLMEAMILEVYPQNEWICHKGHAADPRTEPLDEPRPLAAGAAAPCPMYTMRLARAAAPLATLAASRAQAARDVAVHYPLGHRECRP